MTRSADDGAKAPMLLATDPNLESTGKLFSANGQEMEIDPVGLDLDLARKLFAVDAYWTDLLPKDELVNLTKTNNKGSAAAAESW